MRFYKTTLQKKKEFFLGISSTQSSIRLFVSLLISLPVACRWVELLSINWLHIYLQEYPVQGRNVVRQYYFHFQMIALIILLVICSLESFKYPIPWLWWSILNLQISCEWSFVIAIVKTFEHVNQKFNIHSKYPSYISIINHCVWCAVVGQKKLTN